MICVNCLRDDACAYVGSRLLCGVCFLRYSLHKVRQSERTKPVSYMDAIRKVKRETKRGPATKASPIRTERTIMSSTTPILPKDDTERRKRAFALWENRVETLKESVNGKKPEATAKEKKKAG